MVEVPSEERWDTNEEISEESESLEESKSSGESESSEESESTLPHLTYLHAGLHVTYYLQRD